MSNRHPSDYFVVWDPTMTCINASRDKTYWPVGGPLVSASARRCCGFSQPIDFRLNHGIRLENWHWCKRSGVFLSWGTALTRSLYLGRRCYGVLSWVYIYITGTRFALCCVMLWLRLCRNYPYPSGLLHWHRVNHDDVIKWKHFPRYWPIVRGIHRSPVNSPHKGQWRVALMFSLICARINGWINNREAGDLRRYRAHYDVIVMDMCLWDNPEPYSTYQEICIGLALILLCLVTDNYITKHQNYHINYFCFDCEWTTCKQRVTGYWFEPVFLRRKKTILNENKNCCIDLATVSIYDVK